MTGPYIVTTKRALPGECVSCNRPRAAHDRSCPIGINERARAPRHAVATLEEAREAARELLITGAPGVGTGALSAYVSVALHLPDSGGTVGPLPDGTVIEVEQTTWARLADECEKPDWWTRQHLLGAENGNRSAQQRILTAWNAKHGLAAAPGIGDEVNVEAIVAVTSGEPAVTMRAGEAAWQFTPAQARQHALIVLDKAVEAERDAATVAFLRKLAEDGGDTEEEGIHYTGAFLQGMREHRTDWLEQMRNES